jgi:ferredoxin
LSYELSAKNLSKPVNELICPEKYKYQVWIDRILLFAIWWKYFDVDPGGLIIKSLRRKIMRVVITEQCMGDRNCNKLCPEIFEYDEDQLLSIVKMDEIPEHLKAIVLQAASECGADAIEVFEND